MAANIPLILSVAFSIAESRNILREITWKKADTTEIALFAIIVAIIVLSLILIPKILRNRDKKRQKNEAQIFFDEETKKLGFTVEDNGWATQLCTTQTEHPLYEVLHSPLVFEKAVHAFLLSKSKEGKHVLVTAAEAVSRIRFKIGFRELSVDHPLVSTRNIPPGIVGALFSLPAGREPVVRRARAMDGGELHIVLNIASEEAAMLKPGNNYRFVFTRKGDAAYSVDIMLDSIGADGLFRFNHSLNMARQQSRRYARVEISINSTATLTLRNSEPPTEEEAQARNITLLDFSAGGASFTSEKPFIKGDTISIILRLKTQQPMSLEATVLRTELLEGAATGKTRHHVEFRNIDDSTREKLVRFVLERQLQFKKLF